MTSTTTTDLDFAGFQAKQPEANCAAIFGRMLDLEIAFHHAPYEA